MLTNSFEALMDFVFAKFMADRATLLGVGRNEILAGESIGLWRSIH